MSRSTRISQLSSLSRRLVGTAVEKLLGSILVYCFCGGHIHIALFVNGPAKHRSTQLWLVQSVFFSFLFFCGEKGGIRKKKGKSRKDINNLSSKKKIFFLITLFYLFSMSFLKIKLLETVIPASSSCSYYCYYRCCWWYQPDCTYCRIIQH